MSGPTVLVALTDKQAHDLWEALEHISYMEAVVGESVWEDSLTHILQVLRLALDEEGE